MLNCCKKKFQARGHIILPKDVHNWRPSVQIHTNLLCYFSSPELCWLVLRLQGSQHSLKFLLNMSPSLDMHTAFHVSMTCQPFRTRRRFSKVSVDTCLHLFKIFVNFLFVQIHVAAPACFCILKLPVSVGDKG